MQLTIIDAATFLAAAQSIPIPTSICVSPLGMTVSGLQSQFPRNISLPLEGMPGPGGSLALDVIIDCTALL